MTSLIFVHGTGGRRKAYDDTFEKIKENLQEKRPDVKLLHCLWGDPLGAKLNAGGVSIPNYEALGGGEVPTDEDIEIKLWRGFYRDPFSQMRQMGMRIRPIQRPALGQRQLPSQELKERVETLGSDSELQSRLSKVGDSTLWQSAFEEVATASAFRQLLSTAARPLEADYTVVAQTVVAVYCYSYKKSGSYSVLSTDRNLRNEIVDIIRLTLTQNETDRGVIPDLLKKCASEVVSSIAKLYGNEQMRRKRGALMDATYPFAGDILLYQSKGQKIRDFIHQRIDETQVESPVVLMAHSLGGSACVDLLIERDLSKKVDGLITVGSQAPFFYEIGALQQLEYGEPLPSHFPKKWLNIYDIRDYLSYVGEGLFPGQVVDKLVNNGEPFPESHGAYWEKKSAIWEAIAHFLP